MNKRMIDEFIRVWDIVKSFKNFGSAKLQTYDIRKLMMKEKRIEMTMEDFNLFYEFMKEYHKAETREMKQDFEPAIKSYFKRKHGVDEK